MVMFVQQLAVSAEIVSAFVYTPPTVWTLSASTAKITTSNNNLSNITCDLYLLGSKKTIAFRHANSVSSICTSFNGLTSSSKTREPTLLMSKSDGIPLSKTCKKDIMIITRCTQSFAVIFACIESDNGP